MWPATEGSVVHNSQWLQASGGREGGCFSCYLQPLRCSRLAWCSRQVASWCRDMDCHCVHTLQCDLPKSKMQNCKWSGNAEASAVACWLQHDPCCPAAAVAGVCWCWQGQATMVVMAWWQDGTSHTLGMTCK